MSNSPTHCSGHMRFLVIQKFCQSKISHNCLKIFIKKHVGGFYVTMYYFWIALLMQVE